MTDKEIRSISENLVLEFARNNLDFRYDKSERCMISKIYIADLLSLQDIIYSKFKETKQ